MKSGVTFDRSVSCTTYALLKPTEEGSVSHLLKDPIRTNAKGLGVLAQTGKVWKRQHQQPEVSKTFQWLEECSPDLFSNGLENPAQICLPL